MSYSINGSFKQPLIEKGQESEEEKEQHQQPSVRQSARKSEFMIQEEVRPENSENKDELVEFDQYTDLRPLNYIDTSKQGVATNVVQQP